MHVNPLYILGFLLLVACLALLILETKSAHSARYSEKPILTHAEILFFHRLRIASQRLDLLVFPQVAFSAFLLPKAEGKNAIADFRRISQKRVDFVVVRADTLEIVCLVELDDSSHDLRRDSARDKLTQSAGLVTWRCLLKDKVNTDQIFDYLSARLDSTRTALTPVIIHPAP